MKIIKTVFFAFFLIVLNIQSVFADPDPGPPTTVDPNGPPAPPGPINEHILILVVMALMLGIAVIYKNKIKKASV